MSASRSRRSRTSTRRTLRTISSWGTASCTCLEDKDAAIAKVHRLLKPGGVFVSSTFCGGDSHRWLRFVLPVGQFLGKMPFVDLFTRAELKHSIEEAGFRHRTRLAARQGKGRLHCREQGMSADSLRIDRWLYYCRLFKTRSKATAAVNGGHARLNGERTSPGVRVKPGDRIEVMRDRLLYVLDVVAIPSRRGPAPEARACYTEDEATVERREQQTRALRQDRMLMPKTDGRPDKHTRRKLRERSRHDNGRS